MKVSPRRPVRSCQCQVQSRRSFRTASRCRVFRCGAIRVHRHLANETETAADKKKRPTAQTESQGKKKKKTTNGVEVVAFDRNSIPPRSVSAIRPTPLRHRPATRRGGAGNGRRALKSESTPISRSSSFTCLFFLSFVSALTNRRWSRVEAAPPPPPCETATPGDVDDRRHGRRRRRRDAPPAAASLGSAGVAVRPLCPAPRLSALAVRPAGRNALVAAVRLRSVHSFAMFHPNE